MTVLELIQACGARLEVAGVAFGHGTTNAFDEAVWLALWALGKPLDDLDGVASLPVSSEQRAKVEALVAERIATRKPAAYLTGEAWLQGVPFYIDERVIVPRSFIAEVLASGSIDPWLSNRTHRVLDLCTGNGSLAILAAMAFPNVIVDAADLSKEALAVARINVDRHDLASRIQLLHSDGVDQVQGPYDLILCNPPYVNALSMSRLPQEYRAEPSMALASGVDGMDFCRELISALRANPGRFLTDEAVLILEIGNERDHFVQVFDDLPVVWLDTSGGAHSVLLLTRKALER